MKERSVGFASRFVARAPGAALPAIGIEGWFSFQSELEAPVVCSSLCLFGQHECGTNTATDAPPSQDEMDPSPVASVRSHKRRTFHWLMMKPTAHSANCFEP